MSEEDAGRRDTPVAQPLSPGAAVHALPSAAATGSPATPAALAAAAAAADTTIAITFKLYASLTEYLPAAHRIGNRMPLRLAAGATVAQVIEPFAMPVKLVHLVLVNGHYVPPDERLSRVLVDGDVLAIWPPIAGG